MSPTRYDTTRGASLIISLLGAVFNFAVAIQVLALWRSIKWEPESEWEGAVDIWKIDGVKLVWGLLAAYFASAATACLVGFLGIIKNIPSYVRFYRDYSIADFSFCTFFTAIGAYAAFYAPVVRASICEQLSRQPELMRDMVEMGLNLENCELWFERAVMAFLAIMIVLIVIRLHFLIAVSNYYKHLSRSHRVGLPLHGSSHSRIRSSSLKRIYLLPPDDSTSTPSSSSSSSSEDTLFYAPVPLSTLSPKALRDIRSSATEAWISRTSEPETHKHRHRHQVSSSSSPAGAGTGRIRLSVSPDEGLLPQYRAFGGKA